MSSFTSNFAFQPLSQHHVTSGINLVEAIVCIIAANTVGIIMNFALASSFAISSAASFKLRELQVQTRRKRKQTYRYLRLLQQKTRIEREAQPQLMAGNPSKNHGKPKSRCFATMILL